MRDEHFAENRIRSVLSVLPAEWRTRVMGAATQARDWLKTGDRFPVHSIAIELSTACNRRCYYCPTSQHPFKQEVISDETLELVLGRIKEFGYSGVIGVVRYGEPLLLPNLLDYVSRIKAVLPESMVEVATNGDRLTEALCAAGRAAGVWQFTVSRHPPYSDEWDQRIQRLKHLYPKLVRVPKVGGGSGGELWQTRGGLVKRLPGKNQNAKRCAATQWLVITRLGKVVLCCGDYFAANVMGDLMCQSLESIYYSDRFKQLRNNLRRGVFDLPICRACSKQT